MLNTTTISSTEEKRIVTGMIVSTEFLDAIKPIYSLDYFTNSYLKTVAEWCDIFYEEYEKAPFKHIKDVFEAESHYLDENDVEMIETLLGDLDDKYDEGEINLRYWVDSANDYFRSRELEITINNISVLNEKGDLEGAEKEIENFKKVTLEIDQGVIINPGDIEQQERIYEKREREDKNFFHLPGDLGKYLGNQKRGDVVAYYGPAKRGKTFTLINQWKHGVMGRRKSLFWSIEMTDTECLPRVNKTFYPMINKEPGEYKFPVFDCLHNQTGDCGEGLSPAILYEDGEFTDDPTHIPCTKCRKHWEKDEAARYEKAVYQDSMYRDQDDIFAMRKMHDKYRVMMNRYGRLSVHPKYTLTYDKMMRDLDVLWRTDKWFPDILIIDYIDILGINSSFDDYRLEDERWKLLAKIAGETNTLVITATQANKAGHTTDVLDATHQGGFYGKNRHVNLMVGLNQTAEDKARGVMEFGITEARDTEYIPGQTCAVLQDFKTGQAYLDSFYAYV
ncbi:MAG: hypothetical protein GY797_36300 [Deltaproteobacteria bacterium]|nr:hypothetical protein [Deltaproteobacteria bacterium]